MNLYVALIAVTISTWTVAIATRWTTTTTARARIISDVSTIYLLALKSLLSRNISRIWYFFCPKVWFCFHVFHLHKIVCLVNSCYSVVIFNYPPFGNPLSVKIFVKQNYNVTIIVRFYLNVNILLVFQYLRS